MPLGRTQDQNIIEALSRWIMATEAARAFEQAAEASPNEVIRQRMALYRQQAKQAKADAIAFGYIWPY